MTDKIARINELAKKARESGLTEAEVAERETLRREYIESYRAGLKSQLDSIVIETPDGERHPLKKAGTEGK